MPRIFCHRGIFDNRQIFENTLKAIDASVNNKLGIEFDIRLTKDKELVVYHDDNLKRLLKVNKKIENITYEELKTFTFDNEKEMVPTVKEVLELVKGRVPLLIEIKKTKNRNYLIRELNRLLTDYNGEVILETFDPLILKLISFSSLKRYKRALLVTNSYKGIKDFWYKFYIYNIVGKASYCNFLAVPKALVSYSKKKSTKPLFIWTIKTYQEYLKYCNDSSNLICENYSWQQKTT